MSKRTLVALLILYLACIVDAGNVIILNPGCRQFNSAGDCKQCSTRFYKNKDGICQPVNSNCRTYRTQDGACISCYDGFSIIEDTCLPKSQVDEIATLIGPFANCNQIGDNGVCKKCSTGYYFDPKSFCTKIPETCSNFDIKSARCTGCYQGYSLNQKNQCTINLQTVSDPGCSKFQGDQCVQCSQGYYFNSNRQCKVIPSTCQDFDTFNARCKQCYSGYSLDNKFNCVISTKNTALDLGCSKFENGLCTKCSQGYYFNRNRICKLIPPTCSNFDTTTQSCRGCYPGYSLDNNKNCVQNVATSVDLGCARFQNGKCIRCSFGYYFNKQNTCKMIPATCGNFDTVRQVCTACYPGYILDGTNNCIVSTLNNNDPGCNSFENGKCVKCSFGYYFDRFRNCKQIPPTCSNYDTVKQICLRCYPGFEIEAISNKCVQSVTVVVDAGCSSFANGICLKCSQGYYFDRLRKCALIPPTCSNFDKEKGQCRGCYTGYALDSTKSCIISKDAESIDPGCGRFENGKCMACSVGFYFNFVGICQPIPPTCSNFDKILGVCRGCYIEYQLNNNNQCIPSNAAPSDPNCRQFKNNKCVACSTGAFFDAFGKCITSDPLCKKFNPSSRKCQQCYPGFSLDTLKFTCNQAPITAVDPNCKVLRDNKCAQCSFRYFKDIDGICKSVDPSCRLYSLQTGQCTGCYDGYKVSNKKCVQDLEGELADQNCAQWRNNKCIKCSYGSYFGSGGICRTVDPLCMTWNDVNGQCKSCYPSFQLNLGKCVASTKNYDPNCNKFSTNGVCTQCSRGFYFNSKNICTQVDPLCSSFDSKAVRCLACYNGYKISDGKCVQDTQLINDPGCAQFKNSVCTKCSIGYYFAENNRCRTINPQCYFFDVTTKKCGQCYPGYVLWNDNCIVSNKDNLCAEWKDGICLKCVNRAYFNDQGGCSQVNSYCNEYDIFDGSCQSCYGGFTLVNGNCTRSQSSSGCISFGKDSKCLQCQKRKYLDNGLCLQIDNFCQQFNFFKKTCNKCYRGYTVIDEKCTLSQIKTDIQIENCFTYSLKGDCVECFDIFYLKDNTCNEVNLLCKKYDQNSGQCTDCYAGFKLQKGKCNRK